MKRPRKPHEATERERKTWRGARILRSFNCGGCHELEAESLLVDGKPPAWCAADVKKSGGSVTAYGLADAATLKAPAGPLDVKKSLDRRPRQGADILPLLREYKKDAVRVGYDDSVLNGKMAPSLRLEGSRVRSEWLRDFLKSPTEIRPLLRTLQIRNRSKEPVEEFNLRMPTFPLKDHHLDDLVAYFKASGLQAADPAPPAPAGAKPAALATIKDACNKCHLADASSPVTDPDSAWAPVLKDSARRLRPAFVDAYLRDPLSFDAHSLMPAYNPKDPAEYKALVQALMSLK